MVDIPDVTLCEELKAAFSRSCFTNAKVAKDYGNLGFRHFYEGENRKERVKRKIRMRLYRYLYFLYAMVTELVGLKDVLGLVLCSLVTWLFYKMDWILQYKPSMIMAAVIFPIAFTINSAYTRREAALLRSPALSIK